MSSLQSISQILFLQNKPCETCVWLKNMKMHRSGAFIIFSSVRCYIALEFHHWWSVVFFFPYDPNALNFLVTVETKIIINAYFSVISGNRKCPIADHILMQKKKKKCIVPLKRNPQKCPSSNKPTIYVKLTC